ncbi:MAG: radical SAM protein [Coriobacteriia bacterium]|nr:radical SAM protein [Coriobacteriia bacterium]
MNRKSLLYESKVEYGGWTINHAQGCSHGCRYPCYAMMLAQRTGRAKTYEDWCAPKLVDNALSLLDAEIPRLRHRVESVHLSFTTDPFMFDAGAQAPLRPMVELTTAIIRRLNDEGIRVTTLTKGVYPDDFIEQVSSLHDQNQYGVSVVSLSEDFREWWEPGAAPIASRLASARRLADAGGRTWASIEPYPTPNVDPTSADIRPLLSALESVRKVVFGKWNYSSLVSSFPEANGHYEKAAVAVAAWSQEGGKILHIKNGTPLSEAHSADVLSAG